MTEVEGTLDFYLQQGTALRLLYEKAEPNLIFTQFVDPVPEDDDSFIYAYDDAGMGGDAKKKQPAHVQIGGDFPEVDFSRGKVTPGMLDSRGFQVRIKHSIIRKEPKGISEVQKAYKFAGYWIADYINTTIATAITAGATTPTWTPTSVWSTTATATPMMDLVKFKNAIKTDGYEYRVTDMFAHGTSLNELEEFLLGSDNPAYRDAVTGRTGDTDSLVLPMPGRPIFHGCPAGITDGYLLGLDKNNPCAEYHYYVDPQFGTKDVQYNTVIDGKKQMVTAQNLGIHYDTWVEKGSEDTLLKFWVEGKPVVTKALAAIYDSGI